MDPFIEMGEHIWVRVLIIVIWKAILLWAGDVPESGPFSRARALRRSS
jgi:hypothetical protein